MHESMTLWKWYGLNMRSVWFLKEDSYKILIFGFLKYITTSICLICISKYCWHIQSYPIRRHNSLWSVYAYRVSDMKVSPHINPRHCLPLWVVTSLRDVTCHMWYLRRINHTSKECFYTAQGLQTMTVLILF